MLYRTNVLFRKTILAPNRSWMNPKNEFEEARQCFENSLAINPSHVCSLFQLGKVYYNLGYNRLAEHTLKIAVRVDPVSEDLWSLLGLVTEALAHEYVTQG